MRKCADSVHSEANMRVSDVLRLQSLPYLQCTSFALWCRQHDRPFSLPDLDVFPLATQPNARNSGRSGVTVLWRVHGAWRIASGRRTGTVRLLCRRIRLRRRVIRLCHRVLLLLLLRSPVRPRCRRGRVSIGTGRRGLAVGCRWLAIAAREGRPLAAVRRLRCWRGAVAPWRWCAVAASIWCL